MLQRSIRPLYLIVKSHPRFGPIQGRLLLLKGLARYTVARVCGLEPAVTLLSGFIDSQK